MQCTVSNDDLRAAIGALITELYNSDVAARWLGLLATSLADLIFVVTHVPDMVFLFEETLAANTDGFIRLETIRP
jgi:hypothetical protein